MRYEPEAVQVKFDLTAKTLSVQPVAFDLVEKRVVYMDITTGGDRYQTAHGGRNKMAETAGALMDMRKRRVTLHDVAMAHATARGTLVSKPELADIVFDVKTDIENFEAMMEVAIPEVEPEVTFKF